MMLLNAEMDVISVEILFFHIQLESKDSDYEGLRQRHRNHQMTVEAVKKTFE